MASLKAPCKDCEERHFGCHASCERYKEFLKEKPKAGNDPARDFLAEGAAQRKKPFRK